MIAICITVVSVTEFCSLATQRICVFLYSSRNFLTHCLAGFRVSTLRFSNVVKLKTRKRVVVCAFKRYECDVCTLARTYVIVFRAVTPLKRHIFIPSSIVTQSQMYTVSTHKTTVWIILVCVYRLEFLRRRFRNWICLRQFFFLRPRSGQWLCLATTGVVNEDRRKMEKKH